MITLKKYQELCQPNDVTVITVSYNTDELLKLNISISRIKNPNFRTWWLVIDNSFEITDGWIDDDQVVVLPGTCLSTVEFESIAYGSIHHAKALNVAISYLK